MPYEIIGFSILFSLIVVLIFVYFFYEKNKIFFNNTLSLDKANINENKMKKIMLENYKIFKKSGLKKKPEIKMIESKLMFAYSYSLISKDYIKMSTALVENLNTKSVSGVIAHEYNHLIHRDSHKKIYSLILWIFFSFIWFFVFGNSTFLLVLFFLITDLFKLRKQEYASDIKAVQLTSFETILDSLFDFYAVQQMKEKDAWTNLKKANTKDKIGQLINFLKIKITRLSVSYLGTHPDWISRIKNVLEYQKIDLSDKEFEIFCTRALIQKKEHPKQAINWLKIGLISKKMFPK